MQCVSKQRNCKHVYKNRYFPRCLCRVLIREVNSDASSVRTPVEAGSNTSTVTLGVAVGDEKGSLKSEAAKYGRKYQKTPTWERLLWQGPAAYIKDRPVLSSERAPHKNKKPNSQTVINIWSWAPDGTRHQDLLSDWPSVAMWLWLCQFSSVQGSYEP
jgi:hypothetical protein